MIDTCIYLSLGSNNDASGLSQPKEEPDLEPMLPEESPVVKRPSPLAIRIIEKFLRQKKIRLIDLFQSVDKDKDWKVSRNEFRNAMKAVSQTFNIIQLIVKLVL